MKILAIFDNGGASFDRYTVVTDEPGSGYQMYMSLGLSHNPNSPQGFSSWSDAQFYPTNGRWNRHLGKRIQFEQLNGELQSHIARRIFGE